MKERKKSSASAKSTDGPKPKGRPSSFTQEIADKILEQIATTSKSLKKICMEEGMPEVSTVYRWLRDFEIFSKQYARAKEDQADLLAEQILEIADDDTDLCFRDEAGNARVDHGRVQHNKLRVEARKWYASKLKAKKYGDKIDVTTKGESVGAGIGTVNLNGISNEELAQHIAELRKKEEGEDGQLDTAADTGS